MSTKATILKAIRQNCLDCMCGQATEVKLCPIQKCTLYPYRFGKDPSPRKLSEEELAKRVSLLTTARMKQKTEMVMTDARTTDVPHGT